MHLLDVEAMYAKPFQGNIKLPLYTDETPTTQDGGSWGAFFLTSGLRAISDSYQTEA